MSAAGLPPKTTVSNEPMTPGTTTMTHAAITGWGKCLPPAVLNFMVAEQYNQEPGKVASIVLIGNTLSILFVPLGLALALH